MIDPSMLRRPEEELFRTPQAAQAYLEDGRLDIRKPFAPVAPSDPIDWRLDPYGDKTWRLYFHSFYWVHAIDLAIDLDPDREAELVEVLRRAVMSYIDFVATEGTEAVDATLDDHSAAYRLSHISFVYAKRLHGVLDADETARLADFARSHLDLLLGYLASEKWKLSNHTLFQVEGVLDGAATFLEGEERRTYQDAALDEFFAWLGRIVDAEEGSAAEHAAFYHVFLMARIKAFADYAAPLVGGDRLEAAHEVVRRMAPFLWDMIASGRRMPAFGDSKLAMRAGEKYLEPFLSDPFLTETGARLEQGLAPEPGLRAYPRNGYYFARTGRGARATFLTVLDKPFVGPHGHNDGLGFELWHGGEPILVDSGGPYKYGNKMRFQYFRKPIAHNVVVIGDGQADYTSRMPRADFRQGVAIFKGFARIAPGLAWRRGIVLLRTAHLVVLDLLTGDLGERSAYARFQLAPGATLGAAEDGARWMTSAGGRRIGIATGETGGGAPVHRRPDPFVLETEPGTPSLHEAAFVTLRDNAYERTEMLAVPMGSGRVTATVFSLSGGRLDLSLAGDDPERGCRIGLDGPASGPRYGLDVSEMRGEDGAVEDFRISAHLEEG